MNIPSLTRSYGHDYDDLEAQRQAFLQQLLGSMPAVQPAVRKVHLGFNPRTEIEQVQVAK
jgi:hypothetical protein